MKTILLSAILSLLFISPLFSASPIFHVRTVEGEAALVVQLANLEKARTEIFLQTIEGRRQYSNYFTGRNGHSLKLAMEGMQDGTYLLGMSNRSASELVAFRYASGKISFFEEQDNLSVKNGISRNVSQPLGNKDQVIAHISAARGGGVINVQLSNLKALPVHTSIISLAGVNWYEEVNEVRNGFSRNYLTRGLPDADYYLYIKVGATQAIQFFRIKGDDVVLGNLQRIEVPAGERS
ncbi:MAG: hypothetical protein J5I94_14595 [Phaeodactylibacter sp.]|nr:hypothetical protein [Phaeodactylibacter sp.]